MFKETSPCLQASFTSHQNSMRPNDTPDCANVSKISFGLFLRKGNFHPTYLLSIHTVSRYSFYQTLILYYDTFLLTYHRLATNTYTRKCQRNLRRHLLQDEYSANALSQNTSYVRLHAILSTRSTTRKIQLINDRLFWVTRRKRAHDSRSYRHDAGPTHFQSHELKALQLKQFN